MTRLILCLSVLVLSGGLIGCKRPISGKQGEAKPSPNSLPPVIPPVLGGQPNPIVSVEEEAGIEDHFTRTMKDPKWLKGPAVAQALVGRWRKSLDPNLPPHGYDFHADGTFALVGGLKYTGDYRLAGDSRYLELTTRDHPVFKGQEKRMRFRILVDNKELVFGNIHPDGRVGFGFPLLRLR